MGLANEIGAPAIAVHERGRAKARLGFVGSSTFFLMARPGVPGPAVLLGCQVFAPAEKRASVALLEDRRSLKESAKSDKQALPACVSNGGYLGENPV